MNFSTYLQQTGLSLAEFTRRSGIARPQYVWRYAHGLRIPGVGDMRRIYRATNGQVTANDFYGLAGNAPQPVLPGDAASPEVQEVVE